VQQEEEEDLDADAEGDEDLEGDDGEDDLTLYCFCNKQSFGDMIGCDNKDCPYQWFHIECVGVKTPLPDKWYCPECINVVKPPTERRKGRKK
jgi:chromatin modification-related protein YNG2